MPASQANTILRIGLVVLGDRGSAHQGARDRGLLALHGLHVRRGFFQVAARGAGDAQEPDGQHERDGCCGKHRDGDPEQVAASCHGPDREDRSGCGRPHEAGVERDVDEDTSHATGDDRQHEDRLHEHVREVDLVDTAEELDDDGAGGRRLGDALAGNPVAQQDAKPRTGVGLEQEQHRLAGLDDLGRTQRGQDAMVDGVVEEQDLGRLDEDRGQWQQAVVDQGVDDVGGRVTESGHQWADQVEAEHCQRSAQDPGGEVVDEHLEARPRSVANQAVPLLDDPGAQAGP